MHKVILLSCITALPAYAMDEQVTPTNVQKLVESAPAVDTVSHYTIAQHPLKALVMQWLIEQKKQRIDCENSPDRIMRRALFAPQPSEVAGIDPGDVVSVYENNAPYTCNRLILKKGSNIYRIASDHPDWEYYHNHCGEALDEIVIGESVTVGNVTVERAPANRAKTEVTIKYGSIVLDSLILESSSSLFAKFHGDCKQFIVGGERYPRAAILYRIRETLVRGECQVAHANKPFEFDFAYYFDTSEAQGVAQWFEKVGLHQPEITVRDGTNERKKKFNPIILYSLLQRIHEKIKSDDNVDTVSHKVLPVEEAVYMQIIPEVIKKVFVGLLCASRSIVSAGGASARSASDQP